GPVILRFDKAARPGMTVAQHFPLAPREQVEGWDVVAEGRPGFSPGAVPVKRNRHDRLRFAFPRSVSREPAVEGGAADFCYGSVGIPGSRALRWMRTGDKKQVHRVQPVPAGIGAVAGERGVVCIALAASVLAIYDSPGTGAAEVVAVGRHEHAGTGTTQGAIGKVRGPTGEGRAEIELASLRFVQRIPDGLKVSAVVGVRHERIDGHDNTPLQSPKETAIPATEQGSNATKPKRCAQNVTVLGSVPVRFVAIPSTRMGSGPSGLTTTSECLTSTSAEPYMYCTVSGGSSPFGSVPGYPSPGITTLPLGVKAVPGVLPETIRCSAATAAKTRRGMWIMQSIPWFRLPSSASRQPRAVMGSCRVPGPISVPLARHDEMSVGVPEIVGGPQRSR